MRSRQTLLLLSLLFAAPSSPAQDETGFALPPLSDLTAIVDRPLFVPTRQGTDATAVPAGPGKTADRRLIGIVKRGGQGAALLLLDQRPRTLAVGQVLDGWRLDAVEPGAALLSHADGRTLRLSVGKPLP